MIELVQPVAFGRQATSALDQAIRAAQRGRPLAPVTVVVPSNLCGLAARRTLVTDLGARRGLINVDFVTVVRLAELLTADTPGGGPRLTNPVLASAVRRALADDPRPFGEVAGHVATEAAVAATCAELSRLSPAAVEAAERAPGGSTAVELYRRVARRLDGFDDEDAIVRQAAADDRLQARVVALGHVVWYLPDRLTDGQTQLLRRVLGACPSTVIVGLTGNRTADAPTRRACAAAGADMADAPSTAPPPPTAHADHIISVADADQEVAEAVRGIFGLLADGVPAERIGLYYTAADPYLRIFVQRLRMAELAGSGPRPGRLAHTVPARLLIAGLGLASQGWRRDRVLELVADAPVRVAGRRVHTVHWDRLSRHAGVVAGLDDWRRKLAGLIADLNDVASRAEPDSARRRAAERDGAAAGELAEFVDHLSAATAAVQRAGTWSAKAGAAEGLLTGALGSPAVRQRWPDDERDAYDQVLDALSRLAGLDPIEPAPTAAVFLRALEGELDTSRGRSRPFGTGVHYGPLAAATGQDLDAVFVLGMVEGLCPRARRDEALLPEAARAATGGELLTSDDDLAAQHRALLAALAAAPPGGRTLTVARGDLRSSRRPLPSRWLLDSASELAGHRVYSTDFAGLRAPGVRVVASYTTALTTADSSPSATERDLAAVCAHVAGGADALTHPACVSVRQAITMQRARRSTRFSEFDGNLAGSALPSPGDADGIVSATRLETWASCGFRYLLQHVLGVSVLDDPERIVTVSPLDRGSVLHDVLARFFGERIAAGPPAADQAWDDDARDRLHQIANECFDDLAARGRSGRPLLWAARRRTLHRLLDDFLGADDQVRAVTGGVPLAVEATFGQRGLPPATIDLGGSRRLRLRGAVDRVDRTPAGLAVYDYKSGKGNKYAGLDSDPVLGGTTLQLGVYAEAMRQVFGVASVDTHYWLVERKEGGDPLVGYRWDDDRQARFLDVVTAIVEGVEAGVYPPRPGEPDAWMGSHENCRFCDFDRVCPVARGEYAAAHAADPALTVLDRLTPAERDVAP